MIYKELSVVSAILPAGTIVGAPLGPIEFHSISGNSDEQNQALSQLRFHFQTVTDGMKETEVASDDQTPVVDCFVQERNYEVLDLSVTENTFIKLRGHFAISPLVFLECGIVSGDSNNGEWLIAPEVNGTDPVVITANNDAAWKQRAVTGSSLSAGDASLIHGHSAYLLLQDVPFTGVIEFHNTVSDRAMPFQWPLFNLPQENYNLPGRQTDGHWLWTDIHDGEEMLKYVRAWVTAPQGRSYPLRLPYPSTSATVVDLPGEPDWNSPFGVYLPIPCGTFRRCVVMLDQHVGPARTIWSASDAGKAGLSTDELDAVGLDVLEAQPIRLPAKPLYDIARRWLNGEIPRWGSRNMTSGLVVWFNLEGFPNCRVALPLSYRYEDLAIRDTDQWGLTEASSINGGVTLLGPIPERVVLHNFWNVAVLTALPVDVVRTTALAAPHGWSRLAFFALTDDDFYSGMAYRLYDLLFKGDSENGKLLSTLPCALRVSQKLVAALALAEPKE